MIGKLYLLYIWIIILDTSACGKVGSNTTGASTTPQSTTSVQQRTACSELNAQECSDAKNIINKICIVKNNICKDPGEATNLKTTCAELSNAECANAQALIQKDCEIKKGQCREKSQLFTGLKDTTPPPTLQTSVPVVDTTGWTIECKSETDIENAKEVDNIDGKNNGRKEPLLICTLKKTIQGQERQISVVYGDITHEKVSAIANAANGSLAGGRGVDGSIHAAAGPELQKEGVAYVRQKTPGGFPVGSAMVTHPYKLKANIDFIVHTVSPGGAVTSQKRLESYSAFYNSMLKASEYGAHTMAIPSLGTGIFGFPIEEATDMFFRAAMEFFNHHPKTSLDEIRITNFDEPTVKAYRNKAASF
jgi:O-acetyl-ADP-ribose deacetylase (regulator of RNase III)